MIGAVEVLPGEDGWYHVTFTPPGPHPGIAAGFRAVVRGEEEAHSLARWVMEAPEMDYATLFEKVQDRTMVWR